jgi:hypothetical protein
MVETIYRAFILYYRFLCLFLHREYQNIENMEATVKTRTTRYPITHYWGMLKDLDDSQKLQLITMLAESVKPAEVKAKKRKPNINDYFGIWSDEEYMDADELVDHLNAVWTKSFAGRWQDDRSAEEIIDDIRSSR